MTRAGGRQGVSAAGEAKGGGGGAVEPVEADEITDVGQSQGQGVVAAAGDIEDLDGVELGGAVGVGTALVGHRCQVEAEASAIEGDGVNAGAAIDPGQLAGVAAGSVRVGQGGEVGGVEHKAIVAAAAQQHIGAAASGDGVVAGTSSEGFADAAAVDGVVVGGANLIDKGIAKTA